MNELQWPIKPDVRATNSVMNHESCTWYTMREPVVAWLQFDGKWRATTRGCYAKTEHTENSISYEVARLIEEQGGLVRDVIAENERLQARVAEMETVNTIKFTVDAEDALKAVSGVINDNARLRGDVDRLNAELAEWRATVAATQSEDLEIDAYKVN